MRWIWSHYQWNQKQQNRKIYKKNWSNGLWTIESYDARKFYVGGEYFSAIASQLNNFTSAVYDPNFFQGKRNIEI